MSAITPDYKEGYLTAIQDIRNILAINYGPGEYNHFISIILMRFQETPTTFSDTLDTKGSPVPKALDTAPDPITDSPTAPTPAPAPAPSIPATDSKPHVASGLVAVKKRLSNAQWKAMGATLSPPKGAAATKGMFLNGDIAVDGRFAFTIPRPTACTTCVGRGVGENCRIPEPVKEDMITGRSCAVCIRCGARCKSL